MRILVVEDEHVSRKGLCEMLHRLRPDSEVISADGSEAALRLLAESSVDLIFLDIHMPGMDGLMLLEQIRKEDAQVNVIMVSAYDQFAYAQRAIRLGAMDFIVKPYAEEIIAQVIDRVEERMSGSDMDDLFFMPDISQWMMQSGSQEDRLAEQLHLPASQVYAGRMYLLRVFSQDGVTHVGRQNKMMKWLYRRVKNAAPVDARVLMLDSENMYPMILLAREDCPLNSGQLMGWLQEAQRLFGAELCCAESHYETNMLGNIRRVYAQCKAQMECVFYLTMPCVVTEETLQMDPRRQLDGKLIDQLQEQIRKGDEEGTRRALEEIRRELAQPPYMPVQRLLYALHMGYINLLSSTGINLPDARRMELAEQMAAIVQKNWRLDRFFEAYEELAVQLAGSVNEVMSRQNMITIQHCLEYLQQHYDDPELNQEMMARKLHFSAGYFGNMFKQTTGESFVVYLNRLRVREAQKLLTNSYLKVYEIAEQTGFASVNYFIRVFKQYTQMSPNRYRMLYSVRGDRT